MMSGPEHNKKCQQNVVLSELPTYQAKKLVISGGPPSDISGIFKVAGIVPLSLMSNEQRDLANGRVKSCLPGTV